MATLTLRERVKQLEANRSKVDAYILQACKNATLRAVEKATEMTPPTQDDLSGTNTRSGEMKARWATDSVTYPYGTSDGTIHTSLGNNAQYASYVNDGHRMDRHFVPGLYINPYSGSLEYDPSKNTGIVVGTKTPYVPGLFMVEAAKEEYRRVLKDELDGIGEVFE